MNQFQVFSTEKWHIGSIPEGKIKTLANYAYKAKAQLIQRMNEKKRMALLVAFVYIYKRKAIEVKENLKEVGSSATSKTNQEKYNAYVSLSNALNGEVMESEQGYLKYRIDESGKYVPANEETSNTTSSMVQTKTAITQVEKVKSYY